MPYLCAVPPLWRSPKITFPLKQTGNETSHLLPNFAIQKQPACVSFFLFFPSAEDATFSNCTHTPKAWQKTLLKSFLPYYCYFQLRSSIIERGFVIFNDTTAYLRCMGYVPSIGRVLSQVHALHGCMENSKTTFPDDAPMIILTEKNNILSSSLSLSSPPHFYILSIITIFYQCFVSGRETCCFIVHLW